MFPPFRSSGALKTPCEQANEAHVLKERSCDGLRRDRGHFLMGHRTHLTCPCAWPPGPHRVILLISVGPGCPVHCQRGQLRVRSLSLSLCLLGCHIDPRGGGQGMNLRSGQCSDRGRGKEEGWGGRPCRFWGHLDVAFLPSEVLGLDPRPPHASPLTCGGK